MKIFVVRADFGQYTDVFKQYGFAGIGWFKSEIPDFSNKDKIKDYYTQTFTNDPKMRISQNVGQIYRFLNKIVPGDIVITPFRDHHLLVGKVSGHPYFQKDETCPYYYRINVDWFENPINRRELTYGLQKTLGSTLTCFNVNQVGEITSLLGLTLPEIMIVKFSIDNLYEEIRNIFLELDATEFENLVNYTLQSLGFEAKQETGKVGDGGIDFEGKLNVFGIASINLQVQVKRYNKTQISEKEIRSFRGALKKDFQGCFITLSGFQKKAVLSAEDIEKNSINLIDGKKFIEIFIEQYDKIMDAIYIDDNDELAEKIKFRKALLPE